MVGDPSPIIGCLGMTQKSEVHIYIYKGYIRVILGLYWGYIKIILGLYKGCIGIMEKTMDTTI